MEHVPVSTVHAVLIADVIVNGVSINVGKLALALVRRHVVRANLLLLLRLVGEVETLVQRRVETSVLLNRRGWTPLPVVLLLLQALQLAQHVPVLLKHVLLGTLRGQLGQHVAREESSLGLQCLLRSRSSQADPRHERMEARWQLPRSMVLGGRREGHAPSHREERFLVRHCRKRRYRSYPLWRPARPEIQKLKLITFRRKSISRRKVYTLMFVVPFFGEEWGRFIIKYQFRSLAAGRPDAQKADKNRQDGSFSGSICSIYFLVHIITIIILIINIIIIIIFIIIIIIIIRQDGSFSGSIYFLVHIKPHHLLVLQSFINSSKSASVMSLQLKIGVVINLLRVN